MRVFILSSAVVLFSACVTTPRGAVTSPAARGDDAPAAPTADTAASAHLPELTNARGEQCGDRLDPASLRAIAAWVSGTAQAPVVGVQFAHPERIGGRLSGAPWIEGCETVEHLRSHPLSLRCSTRPDARQLVVGYAFNCADGLYSLAVTTELDRSKNAGQPLQTSAAFKKLSAP